MVCPSTTLRRNPSRVGPRAKPVYFRCYLGNLIVVTVKSDHTGIVPTSNSSDTLWIINWNRAPGSHKYLGSESARKVGQLFDLARLGRIPDCKIAPMQRIPVVRSDAEETSDSRDGSSRSCWLGTSSCSTACSASADMFWFCCHPPPFSVRWKSL